ncbi:MAG: lantibiotic dehydratase, partial [Pedobacter sp.]|nr:lantibiotic dehydratase [Pedobacter sp.]
MKLKLMEMAICRTPAFGKDEVLEKAWDQLKEKIKESSPAFYQSIKNINADEIDGLPAKMRFTIWKYFSRSKFRATPFGSFSALQLLPIAASAHGPIILSEALTVKRFRDWDEKDTFISDISDILSASTLFYRNSSCYEVMDEIRYIRLRDGKFELSTVKSFPQLKAILDCCSSAQSLEAICKVMKADFELEKKHTQKLLGQLISIQLILNDRLPNIIGEDYFSRLGSPNPSNEQSYAISSRQWKAGALQMKSLENMPKLIQFLSDNLPATENEELLDFKKAFLKKFD